MRVSYIIRGRITLSVVVYCPRDPINAGQFEKGLPHF